MEKKIKKRGFPGTTDISVQPYELKHRQLSRRAAAEAVVLLKNDEGLLPISKGAKIALYGAGARHTIKGGTGSGEVNERSSVTIAEGLEAAGYEITTGEWLDEYDRAYNEARLAWRDLIWSKADADPENPGALNAAYFSTEFTFPTGPVSVEKTEAEIAILVIARVAGEGIDRRAVGGDYYLSEEEYALTKSICSCYENVVLVINSGGQVDLSVLDEFRGIKAVLAISQLGCEGGNAFADVLSGEASPSGKLSSTWAFRYEDYPNSATFSSNNGDNSRELYTEGIYVGYRYFDSFNIPVRFGFGHGRSYAEFSVEAAKIEQSVAENGLPQVELKVQVYNTGRTYSGREVAQVYVSCPQAKMAKEYRRLVGFAKTDVLAPDEGQILSIKFDAYSLASYCEKTPGWVLEAGEYGVFLGASLEQCKLVGVIHVGEDQILTKTTNICPMREELAEIHPSSEDIARRRNEWISASDKVQNLTLDFSAYSTEEIIYGKASLRIPQKARDFVDTLTENQLITLATGLVLGDVESEPMVGASAIMVPGAASQTSGCARNQGLAEIVMADGPAGLRLHQNYYVKDGKIIPEPFEKGVCNGFIMRENIEPEGEHYYQFCTAFPVGTALAQSWNLSLVNEVGGAVGDEMQRFGVTAWLAPGMNIHRNPLCGRNFEYFSEDPCLTGRMAASITHGVQAEPGCGTTIKHFACNNQEDNRNHSDSILSERTLREIYLKGFEIAIKEAQPLMMMSSYNLINGVHAANNYDTCTKVARDEWGFRGFIMTDWCTTFEDPECTAAGCIRAGNDAVMPGFKSDHESIKSELAAGTLSIEELKDCIARQVNVIWQSNAYE